MEIGRCRALDPQPFYVPTSHPRHAWGTQGFSEHSFQGCHRQSSPGLGTQVVSQSRATSLIPDLVILGDSSCPLSQGPVDMTHSESAQSSGLPTSSWSLLGQIPHACTEPGSETWRPCPEHQAAVLASEHTHPLDSIRSHGVMAFGFRKCSDWDI